VHAVTFASWEASVDKTKRTAAELEVMILSRMETIGECPVGMTVIVKRRGNTWEALPISPDQQMYLDCVARVIRYCAVLRTEYDLAE
jgi:hypothetical protein